MCFRGVNISVMTGVVEEAMKLQRDFPDIMAGFDLVRGNSSYLLSNVDISNFIKYFRQGHTQANAGYDMEIGVLVFSPFEGSATHVLAIGRGWEVHCQSLPKLHAKPRCELA